MRRTQFVVAVLAAAGVLTGVTAPAAADVRVPDLYLTQQIQWKPCFTQVPPGLPPGTERLECGSFTAPQNWNHPDGRDITIAVSRLRPASGQATGSVLTNPGGPGAPGRILPVLFLERKKLSENMEIIGIDVRGTGDSSNVTCGGFNALGMVDPRDRSKANLDLLFGTYDVQAKFCQVKSGELGQYISTDQTVKDLDLLRHLLGRNKVNWVGYSGGSWLGAYYATYFPHRVDKFVLDSNAEFTASWQTIFSAFGPAFERRFRTDFLPWVAKYDSVYHLGTTGEQVRLNYEYARARLTERPLPGPDGTLFTATALDINLIRAQYSKHNFGFGAELLAAVRKEVDAGILSAAVPQYPDAWVATQLSILCNDTPFHGDRRFLTREGERLGRQYPLIGYYQVAAPCAYWNRPDVQLKKPTGRGVPPVLMVQSVRDPATPLEGAQRAHQRFAGSRLLTVTDEGDHGMYASGNPCVDDIVEAFIVDGRVPQRDLTCAGTPLPGPVASADQRTGNPILETERLTRLAGPMAR